MLDGRQMGCEFSCVESFNLFISLNLFYSEEKIKSPFNSSNFLYFLLPSLYNSYDHKVIG